ncbi:TetR/AcrR family transcriptional regulator [Cnuibacter physcomitrellae]|uniref:TetR/AcrR family transcriptional regulator n=1 Tax=Cnuibacter physcomitrellae TaxID=1619308 RepID=UPI002877F670|nr:helix-turn-helix domain-containing protein [Cnuibacter physcomitrellae]
MTTDATPPARRSGSRTRELAQQVALRLFTEQGYEATSLRQIADELGINKASLYYHFDGKEAIVQSLLDQRGDEAEELLAWVRAQPPAPDVIAEAVSRWVDSFTEEKLQGIRFLTANPRLLAGMTRADEEPRVGAGLTQLADELSALLPSPTPESAVQMRMALLSINAAVHAAAGTSADDTAIVTAARRAARILTADLLSGASARP